jgi:cell division protein FtsB
MRRLGRPAAVTGILALIVVGITLVATVVPFRHIIEQQRQLETSRAELAALNAENRILEGEVTALNTPGEIERLAREKLGYVMPGEVSYVVLAPDDDAPPVTAVTPSPPPELPWYQAVWNFFTGADLVGG